MENNNCCEKCDNERQTVVMSVAMPFCIKKSCECHSSQNSGDWEGRFDEIVKNTKYSEYMGGGRFCCGGDYCEKGHNEWIKEYIRTEIDRAERRVKDELREKIEELRREPTLCGNCNLNGPLCKECYANRRANSSLKDVLNLL